MDPRARIEAFLADYVAAHAEVKPLFDNRKENGAEDPFSAWYAKLEELRAAHQMERSLKGDIAGISAPGTSHLGTITIERIEVYGNMARARLTREIRAYGAPSSR